MSLSWYLKKMQISSSKQTINNQPGAPLRRGLTLGLLIGLGVGALSFLAQGRLPGYWYHLGNSGSVWVAAAFLAGTFVAERRWAAVSGVLTLLCAVGGYFLTGTLMGVPYALSMMVFWAVVAVVGGPIFGLAGSLWRYAAAQPLAWRLQALFQPAIAAGLLGAAFVAEGVYHRIANPHLPVAWPLMGVGVLIPLLLGRTQRERFIGLLMLLPAVLAGLAVYGLLTLFW
jgi:hypothetical protein